MYIGSWQSQGCQMVYFQIENPNLGKFSSPLYVMDDVDTYILWAFCLFYGHLVYFVAFWYI
jgi:hypothetical protein